MIDAIVTKANKSNNKIEKEIEDEITFVPGLDKCFMEKSVNDKDKLEEIGDKNMNDNAIKLSMTLEQSQKKCMVEKDDTDKSTDVDKSLGDNKLNNRPKSLERDISFKPADVKEAVAAKDDSSPDSEYQSGKESLASESDNANKAQTPGSEVESSVDTGEVFANNVTEGTDNGTTDMDKAAENCIVS